MRTKRTTLSFLTESKASAVGFSSMRRVAMTLLVMLLTTASVWAQNNYWLTLDDNYEGGASTMIPISIDDNTITLTEKLVPTRAGEHTFLGWSTSSTGDVEYKTGDKVTLDGSLTLYAIWGGTVTVNSLTYTITNENLKQVELSGYEGNKPTGALNIPSQVNINGINYSVTSIGLEAFAFCGGLVSVTIPNSVTSIGNNAFERCGDLESITIPYSVTSIGGDAFLCCNDGLTSITVEEGNTFYDSRNNCNAIIETKSNTLILGCKNTIIPNSVTSIGKSAFELCDFTSVSIPNSVTSIGDYAFKDCKKLESVTLPNSVTSIGDFAFKSCNKLTSVTLNSNPRIGIEVFENTPATVTMNLTASNVNEDKWTTFYNSDCNFQADENTTVYKATVDGSSLVLTEVEDKIVNRETAVILKSSGNPVMTLTNSNSNDTNGNDLRGFSERFSRSDVMEYFSVNAIYTMGKTSAGFGFHRYTGEFVPAGKAFLPLNTSNGAKAQSLAIVYAIGSTGINSVSSDSNVQNDWFSLDGARLSGKPSQPGIYVNGKKKIVIK